MMYWRNRLKEREPILAKYKHKNQTFMKSNMRHMHRKSVLAKSTGVSKIVIETYKQGVEVEK